MGSGGGPPGAGRGRPRVVVVGSVNVDLVVRAARLPAAGETVTGGAFSRHDGGKGANQAVAAARLGADVALVGAVGDDDFGRAALAALHAEGVSVDGVAVLTGAPTGVALIVVDERGENQIAVASGANASLDEATVAGALAALPADPAGVVLISFEVGDGAVSAAAAWARASGWPVLVNPAPARPLPEALLAASPVLLPNRGEASALTGEAESAAAAAALSERTGAPVIVTLGPDGALLFDGGRADAVPAPAVGVVDTTGAGDTFCGALAAELAGGASLRDAVRFAVTAASLSVGAAGARAGMPRREAVTAAM